jgi:hypothetical protein
MTTTTVNPTTDNTVYREAVGSTFTALVNGAGTGVGGETWVWDWTVGFVAHNVSDQWTRIRRGVFVFDTSSIPDTDVISAVTFKLGGHSKQDGATAVAPDINVYGGTASGAEDAIAAGDYELCGSTAYCDTAITYANWDVSGVNSFAFNAAGIAAISKTGYTRICVRNANYDVADNAPTWTSVTDKFLASDMDDGSPRPELEIVHAAPSFIPRIMVIS